MVRFENRLTRALALLSASLLAMAGTGAAQTQQSSGLTADTVCNTHLCLNAIYDMSSRRINYTMTTQQGGKQIGWYAVGTGRRMLGSDMMIGWVGTSGQPIMSQRTAGGHELPTTTITAQAATRNDASTFTNSSGTAWSWSTSVAPSSSFSPSAQTSYIWAVNDKSNPGDDPASPFQRHTDFGSLSLDLTKPYTPPADGQSPAVATTPATADNQGGSTSSQSGDSASQSKAHKLVLVHLVCMTAAWLALAPIAVLIGRYGRTALNTWFQMHQYIQVLTIILTIVGFGAIVSVVASSGRDHFESTHAKVGLTIFILALVQGALGLVGHYTKRFHPTRLVHVFLGVATLFLGFYNVGSGWKLYSAFNGTNKAAKNVVWGVGFGLMGGLWVLGLVLLPSQMRAWKAEARGDAGQGGIPTHQRDMMVRHEGHRSGDSELVRMKNTTYENNSASSHY